MTPISPECGSCQQPCRPAVVVHIGHGMDRILHLIDHHHDHVDDDYYDDDDDNDMDQVLHLSQPGYQVKPGRIFTFVKPSRISSQVNQDIPFLPIKYSPLSRLFPISKASAKLADQI